MGKWITYRCKAQNRKNQERFPAQLNKKNQQVNKTKMEEYIINRKGQTDWKRCKYLGSLLDTEEDRKRNSFSNSNYQETEKYSGKQVNINENKIKNSRSLHWKCFPIQLRIVDLDQTTCKGNLYISKRVKSRKSSTYIGKTNSQMWNSIEDTNSNLGVK